MSVHLQMLGRQLPCTLLDLLGVKPLPLPAPAHEDLIARIEGGQNYPDLHYKLGLSHLGRQELGLARKHLKLSVDAKPKYAPSRFALAAVCDLLAMHNEAVDQIDAALGLEEGTLPRAALAIKELQVKFISLTRWSTASTASSALALLTLNLHPVPDEPRSLSRSYAA